MADIIMSWGECDVFVAPTGTLEAMGTPLISIGTIKEKSVAIEMADGEKLQAYASGHKLVAQEEQDGDITITCRVMEPDFEALEDFVDGTYVASPETLTVRSFVITGNFSVEVKPINPGATGVRVRKTSVKVRTGIAEDEGHYADFTFTVLECTDGELLEYFRIT